MIIEIKAPTPGESITEVQIANWLVENGVFVKKDTELAEIDSDKATLTVNAEAAGRVVILVQSGETVAVGTIIATLDTAVKDAESETIGTESIAPAVTKTEVVEPKLNEKPFNTSDAGEPLRITPLARKMMKEQNLSGQQVLENLSQNRITSKHVIAATNSPGSLPAMPPSPGITRDSERKKMSTLRLRLAERLVKVKNETAMLTTFNEVNMSAVMELKKKYNESFKEKHGVGVGFMSFFTKAVTIALSKFPQVNSSIEGDELIIHKYADIGIAVSAPKGLVVPVVRNAESLNLAQIELKIKELAVKARDNKITLDEMAGGTFTITNGGVFGSMMSTPILNPPQSAILGMHNIIERPIAVNGQVVIAPMMYIALSYDHRVIDGRESVGFLLMVKELIENPARMLFDGNDPSKVLLGI